MIDIETYDDNPNLSLIVPAKCDRRCAFCSNKGIDGGPANWLDLALMAIDALPPKFSSVSITGGEPTLYPGLEELMFRVRKRFAKVIVNTNGSRLGEMGFVLKHANAINLSWHGWRPVDVARAFGMGLVKHPDPNAIRYLREHGTGVTLNWVITKDTVFSKDDVSNYSALAEEMGCSAVAFRRDMNDPDGLEMGWVPSLPDAYKKVSDTGCPVCRTIRYERRGFPLFFKASCPEPAKSLGEPFELVFTADGILSTTWDGKNPVGSKEAEMTERDDERLDRIEAMLERLLAGLGRAPDRGGRDETSPHDRRRGQGCHGGGGRC